MAEYQFSDNFMIAWTRQRVEVGRHPDATGWSDGFHYTAGACYSSWHTLDDIHKQRELIECALIIERDGVDAENIKTEFRKIAIWNDEVEALFMKRLNYGKLRTQRPPQSLGKSV